MMPDKTSSSKEPLIVVEKLAKEFDLRKGLSRYFSGNSGNILRAVNQVSFSIERAGTIGLIGESGCGKTTLGRTVLRLQEPTSGQIRFDGRDITHLDSEELKPLRQSMQIIFQDPYASLNPRHTVEDIVGLPMKLHEGLNRQQCRARVQELLARVGLQSSQMQCYPHQFSGGQRQRIGIARALILKPTFVVCDEPVSALDVSIQAQILELLMELKAEFSLTYLFISHDISVVGYIADQIMVMYLGEIVESGTGRDIINAPKHPYTQALLSAVPRVYNPDKTGRIKLKGDLPSPLKPPPGCKFQTRCPQVMEQCRTVSPTMVVLENGQQVACHLYGEKGGAP